MGIKKPDVSSEAAYRAYQTSLENDDNPSITTREIGDFKTSMENSRAQETQTTNLDYSAMTAYYAFLNGKIAVRISCRWQLEKGSLATVDGHIGYQTSPGFRRQDIMAKLLNLALEQYVKRDINPMLITAREDDTANHRTIERAGGILENIIDLEDGHRLACYWITLDLENPG